MLDILHIIMQEYNHFPIIILLELHLHKLNMVMLVVTTKI